MGQICMHSMHNYRGSNTFCPESQKIDKPWSLVLGSIHGVAHGTHDLKMSNIFHSQSIQVRALGI